MTSRVGPAAARLAGIVLVLAAASVFMPTTAGAVQFCYSTGYKLYNLGDVCNQGHPHSITYVQATAYVSSVNVCVAKAYGGSPTFNTDGAFRCGVGQASSYYNGEPNRYAENGMDSSGQHYVVGDFFYN